MGDNRIGHSGRNHLFEVASAGNKLDLFLRSESPRVQQILLHQRLREEIEKNSNGKVRYVDSELYSRNQEQRSPASASSEVQSATLNIGLPSSAIESQTLRANKQTSKIPTSSSLTVRENRSSNKDQQQASTGDGSMDQLVSDANNHYHQQSKRDNNIPIVSSSATDCQVCRIKEVREDLMNLNKMIQERNVHFTELKAKCLRSYFKRQMID